MRAIVKARFMGRPDGEALSRRIEVGDIIIGELAKWAVSAGHAVEDVAEEAAAAVKQKPARKGKAK